jgi:putative ABC transport system substrate-binding protein
LANSTPVTAALREQSQVVPIVFTQVTDPVGEGLVPNLAHPGGNLTGFTSFEFSIGTKWLQALKQTAPHVTQVALVFNPSRGNHRAGGAPRSACGLSVSLLRSEWRSDVLWHRRN